MSTPFSGSTLVSMLLCSQPRSIGFGDTYFGRDSRPENLCTCGVPFLECQPRSEAQDEIRRGGLPDFSWGDATPVPTPKWLSVERRRYWPLSRSISLGPVRAIPAGLRERLFRNYYLENQLMLQGLASSGRYDFYFDGCKDPVRLELLRTALRNLKVIHMVRHPGALAYHFYRLGFKAPERRLGQWIRYHSRVRSFLKYLGEENYLPVTYEHIVEQPGSFLRNVADFLGMPAINESEPDVLKRDVIHIQGNRMRKTAERVLNMADKWRGKMPQQLESESEATLRKLPWAASLY